MRTTRRAVAAAGLAAALAMGPTACGGGEDPFASDVRTSGPTRTVDESARPSSTATNTPPDQLPDVDPPPAPPEPEPDPEPAGPATLAWLPFGPSTPNSPGATLRLYSRLHTDCTSTVGGAAGEGLTGDHEAFWRAAALLCAGIRTGDARTVELGLEAWGDGRDHDPENCFEERVRAATAPLADAARSGPLPRLVGAAPGFACTPEGLQLNPTSGPADTPVEIRWQDPPWMATTMTVRFGGVEAEWTFDEGPGFATYRAPEGLEGTVPVVLHYVGDLQVQAGEFTYEAAPVDPPDAPTTGPSQETGTGTVSSTPPSQSGVTDLTDVLP